MPPGIVYQRPNAIELMTNLNGSVTRELSGQPCNQLKGFPTYMYWSKKAFDLHRPKRNDQQSNQKTFKEKLPLLTKVKVLTIVDVSGAFHTIVLDGES